jgi:hypothetical protein
MSLFLTPPPVGAASFFQDIIPIAKNRAAHRFTGLTPV